MGILITLYIITFIYAIRNNMVYSLRIEIIETNYDLYHKMPSYNKLLISIWLPLNKNYWIKKLKGENK
jgi:hypothetical protein